jgi:hypothetical protein
MTYAAWCQRVATYITRAYPRRYPKMVTGLHGPSVFVAFERDEALDGSTPFALHIYMSRRSDYASRIEKARICMEHRAK